MKQKLLALLTAGALTTLCLTGCAQEPEPLQEDESPLSSEELTAPTQESVLPRIFSLPYSAAQTLDPIICSDGMQQVVASLCYEGLFRLDASMQPENRLCSAYSYDAQTFTYVFTLRPGVLFSDGSPLTAQDVTATLERARTSTRYSARFTGVASITAMDGAVSITLSAPNTGFPALLDIPITKADSPAASIPPGTGPYCYTETDGVPALRANPHWWQQSVLPVDSVGLVDNDNRAAMLYRFTSHDVQLICADLTGSAPISVTGDIHCQDATTTIFQYLAVNTTREPLNRAEFRKALSLGTNRATLVSAYLSGHAAPAQFPLLPASPLYPADLEERYSYDAFTQAAAGIADWDQTPLTLLVSDGNTFRLSAAGFLADSYTAVGIPTQVRALPWEEYLLALQQGDFDLCYCEVKLTADWNLRPLLETGGTLNYGGWSDFLTNQLLSAALSGEDRTAAYRELCKHLQAQSPIIPLCFKSVSVLTQAHVLEGMQPTAAEPLCGIENISIHLEKE